MQYEYIVAYQIWGIEYKPQTDLELLAIADGSVRAILTRNPDKYNCDIDNKVVLLSGLADWLKEQQPARWMIEQCRQMATEPHAECADAPHLVVQTRGDTEDLNGKELFKIDNFVVHLELHDPNELIRREGDVTVAAVLASLALEAGGTITFNRVWDCVVIRRADGKRAIPCRFSQSIEFTDFDSLASDAPTRLTNRFHKLSLRKNKLGTILRLLKMSYETEEDKLRSFLFGWNAIEMFTTQLFSSTYKNRMPATLSGVLKSKLPSALAESICHVMEGKYSLADKFAVLATHLCPTDADKDDVEFRKIKKVRNELFHGSSADESLLPVTAVRGLLIKYLQLHLGESPRLASVKKTMRMAGHFDPSRKQ